MNENHWYPRDPQRFLTDTQWCDHATETAHNRMTDTYYALGKPLLDNKEEIQNIGKIKDSDYARVRGNLMRLGWSVVDGFWRHKRIEETLREMDEQREERIQRTEAARKARTAKNVASTVTAHVTDVVAKSVTDNVTSDVEPSVTATQPQPQPQPQPHNTTITTTTATPPDQRAGAESLPVELPLGFPTTQAEAVVAASFVGCPEELAVKAWNKAMSRGGRDSKDIPIRNWRAHLATEWAYDRARTAERAAGQGNRADRPAGAPTRSEVVAYAAEKWADQPSHVNWAISFHAHWADPKRNWERQGRLIDWKIELSQQVSKWRQQ